MNPELKLKVTAETSTAVKAVQETASAIDKTGVSATKTSSTLKALDSGFENVRGASSKAVSSITAAANSQEKLSVSATKARSGLSALAITLKSLPGKINETGERIETLGKKWGAFTLTVRNTFGLFSDLKNHAESAFSVLRDGANFAASETSFRRYAASLGADADSVIANLERVSSGMLSKQAAIQTASRAMALGVTTDADAMGKLFALAGERAKLFGLDASQAFDDIVAGIGRGSPLILDNLGIRIPEGFEKMTEGMTAAQKTAKLLEETLKAGAEDIKAFAEAGDSTAVKVGRLEASVANLARAFKIDLSENLVELIDIAQKEGIPLLKSTLEMVNDIVGGLLAPRMLKMTKEKEAALWKEDSIAGTSFRRMKFTERLREIERAKEAVEEQRQEILKFRSGQPKTGRWSWSATREHSKLLSEFKDREKTLRELEKKYGAAQNIAKAMDKDRERHLELLADLRAATEKEAEERRKARLSDESKGLENLKAETALKERQLEIEKALRDAAAERKRAENLYLKDSAEYAKVYNFAPAAILNAPLMNDWATGSTKGLLAGSASHEAFTSELAKQFYEFTANAAAEAAQLQSSVTAVSLETLRIAEKMARAGGGFIAGIESNGLLFSKMAKQWDDFSGEAEKSLRRSLEFAEKTSAAMVAAFAGTEQLISWQKSLTPESALKGLRSLTLGMAGLPAMQGKQSTKSKSAEKTAEEVSDTLASTLTDTVANAVTDGFMRADFSGFLNSFSQGMTQVLAGGMTSTMQSLFKGQNTSGLGAGLFKNIWGGSDGKKLLIGSLATNVAISAGVGLLSKPGVFGARKQVDVENIDKSRSLNEQNKQARELRHQMLIFTGITEELRSLIDKATFTDTYTSSYKTGDWWNGTKRRVYVLHNEAEAKAGLQNIEYLQEQASLEQRKRNFELWGISRHDSDSAAAFGTWQDAIKATEAAQAKIDNSEEIKRLEGLYADYQKNSAFYLDNQSPGRNLQDRNFRSQWNSSLSYYRSHAAEAAGYLKELEALKGEQGGYLYSEEDRLRMKEQEERAQLSYISARESSRSSLLGSFLADDTMAQLLQKSGGSLYDFVTGASSAELSKTDFMKTMTPMIAESGDMRLKMAELSLKEDAGSLAELLRMQSETAEKAADFAKKIADRMLEASQDMSKTIEEQVAAFENYQAAERDKIDASIKLLQYQKQLEDAKKQERIEQSGDAIAKALSVIGEWNRHETSAGGERIVALYANDPDIALEMLSEHLDDPEVAYKLKQAAERSRQKARFG